MTAPYDEARLAQLIAALPPAPAAWVEAACTLPDERTRVDDLGGALRSVRHATDPDAVAALRARLTHGD